MGSQHTLHKPGKPHKPRHTIHKKALSSPPQSNKRKHNARNNPNLKDNTRTFSAQFFRQPNRRSLRQHSTDNTKDAHNRNHEKDVFHRISNPQQQTETPKLEPKKNSLNNSKLHETITNSSQPKNQQNIHFNSPLPPLPKRRIPEHFKNQNNQLDQCNT